ncbi:MAG: SH3 domain-containing protein [Pseudomonadota bacterium]
MVRASTSGSAILAASTAVALACGGNPTCTVADPTGTPLNIRQAPNQKILATAPNGTVLEFIDHVEHEGQTWARVASFNPKAEELTYGAVYVFASYLDCDADPRTATDNNEILCRVADPTGTPLNLREAPNGALLGSVQNGETIRVYNHQIHNGKVWAQAYRNASDNSVGWVFDAYLKCEEDGH